MALIENLEHDDWRSFLGVCFEQAIQVLATDRSRWAGSSTDDLKNWLAAGGMQTVKQRLNRQMDTRQFSMTKRVAINDTLNYLATKHRQKLLALMIDDIISVNKKELLNSLSLTEKEFKQSFPLILAGNNLLEDWMKDHYYSDMEISTVHRIINDLLIGHS